MKLHDRNLVAFASSPQCVDRQDYLYQRDDCGATSKYYKRWFVLKSNVCFYFERQGDREPVGVIILENCTVEMAEDDVRQYCFKISFVNGARDYRLSAGTHQLMEVWIRALSSASFVYMQLTVCELQRQVHALTAPQVSPAAARRHNPFHSDTEVPSGARQSFRALHRELGRLICYDRENWRAKLCDSVQLIAL